MREGRPGGRVRCRRSGLHQPRSGVHGGTARASDEEKLLLLEHADSSAITVLHQEGDYAGLQGRRPDGTWSPVPIRPDALQVFTGILLTNWTEGRLRPGRHRVVPAAR
ncbi:2OG-Fe(II) oxygenase family protein [Streptomyces avermitilis]|uniref:2OG-Fe(II) oxygenase family protein n=1 Tax=Streptomyces avermitilis TaxID=33903 RepID=UPI0033C5D0C9